VEQKPQITVLHHLEDAIFNYSNVTNIQWENGYSGGYPLLSIRKVSVDEVKELEKDVTHYKFLYEVEKEKNYRAMEALK